MPRKPRSPEATAAWKASIAANPANNKPASGIPAMGAGWGGEASNHPRPAFSEDPLPYQGKRLPADLKERKEEILDELRLKLVNIALDEDTPLPLQIIASDKALDRLEGKPGQKLAIVGGDDGDNPVSTTVTVEFVRPGSGAV